jgi:hypothetical protein
MPEWEGKLFARPEMKVERESLGGRKQSGDEGRRKEKLS